MPRKSRVDKVLEKHPSEAFEPPYGNPGFIILYSFNGKTKTRFYEDLEKLKEKVKYTKLGGGILLAEQSNDAYSLMMLIHQYGCKFSIYKTHEIDILDLLAQYLGG